MEAYFDNQGDVLNAHIRVPRDDSIIYTIKTTFGLRGRMVTVLRDENPALLGGKPAVVGYINWREKTMDVCGVRRKVKDIRRTEGKLWKRSHFWRWGPESKRVYQIDHHKDGWKVTVDNNTSIVGQFQVPLRPLLFGKPDPTLLHLTRTALEQDEVFLILALIYSEARRQDKSNCSSANGNVGW